MPPAGQVQIQLTVNQAQYTAGLQAAQRQLGGLKAAATSAGTSTVGSMQAASASIRALENPLAVNIRTLARFAAQSEILRNVFQAAFPVVGIIAAGAAVAKLGMAVSNFIKETNDIPNKIKDGFGQINSAAQLTNDALAVSNDKLEQQLAKLEKKPQNGLKLALDEARESADKLSDSLGKDITAVNALIAKNSVGFFGQLLGQKGTADSAKMVTDIQGQIDSIRTSYQETIDTAVDGGSSKQNIVDIKTAEMVKLQQVYSDASAKIKPILHGLQQDLDMYKSSNGGRGRDTTSNVNLLSGFVQQMQEQQKMIGQTFLGDDLKGKVDDAQANKGNSENSKSLSKAHLDAMEEELNAEKRNGNNSVKFVHDFWVAKQNALQEGSADYINLYKIIDDKVTSAAVEGAQKAHESLVKAAELIQHNNELTAQGPGIINRYSRDAQENALKSGNEQNQGFIDNNQEAMDSAKNTAREQEAKLTDDAGRSISRYSAALQQANIHAQEYLTIQESLKAIEDIRAQQQKADPNKETDRNLAAAQMALANAQAQRQIQISNDSNTLNPSSSGVAGFQDAINEFVNASKDAASQMRDLTLNTIQGLNETIKHVLVTPHMTGLQTKQAFGAYGANLFGNVAGTGLEKVEGGLLGAVGGGKLGTKGNPMVVTFADGTTSAGGLLGKVTSASGIGGIFSKLFGGGGTTGPGVNGLSAALGQSADASISDEVSGGLKTAGTDLLSMIPFLASGGPIDGPAIVGEQGPELFMPSSAGTIVPNHKLKASGSSSNGGHTFNIDARGATDPAQVNMQITQALRQAAPMITAHTISTQKEGQMRRAPSQRG